MDIEITHSPCKLTAHIMPNSEAKKKVCIMIQYDNPTESYPFMLLDRNEIIVLAHDLLKLVNEL